MKLFGSRGSIGWLIAILITCIIGAGGYFGYPFFLAGKNTPREEAPIENPVNSGATIATSTGTIIVSKITGSAFIKGNSGDTVLENEKTIPLENIELYTSSGSRVSLIFPDRSIVRLDANTEVSVLKGTGGNTVLSLEKGRLWARIIGQAGGSGKVVISLGSSEATVQGTSVEALRLPLLSKYTVLDSSSMSGSESAGIDVTDSSGTVTHVQPENKWVGTEFGETIVKPINIADVYKNDAFVLMNTQEDIVYLQNAIAQYSGSIDVEKAKGEILSSLPAIGSNESVVFFSGTTIDTTTLSGDISSSDWTKMTEQVLSERMADYTNIMEKNEAYINQVTIEQEKLRDSLLKSTGKMLDETKDMVNGIIHDQEFLIANIIIQNGAFLEKINEDMATLIGDQQKMVDGIMKDTMDSVNTTLTNVSISSISGSTINESNNEISTSTNIENDPFFVNKEAIESGTEMEEVEKEMEISDAMMNTEDTNISSQSDGSQSISN